MTIEIFGAGFTNKGAELMLRTTAQRLRQQNPDLRLAIEPDGNTPYERTSELQLAQIFPAKATFSPRVRQLITRSSWAQKLIYSVLNAVMPDQSERVLGLVNRKHADALVDISGYAFGDGFSPLKCRNAAARTGIYARRGKPVILMPQMFGPFENPNTRRHFKSCCDNATLIYAREQASFDAVREVIGDDPRLKIAPDITIFSSPPQGLKTSDLPTTNRPYAVIVPNLRMLDQGCQEWGESYIARLVAAGKRMIELDIEPILLVHSNEAGDYDLAKQVGKTIDGSTDRGPARIFTHPNPYILKKFIAGARYLIGSRFHSLVAALSSGVPGVALGWAHKYDMLASDFGVPHLIHRGTDKSNALIALIDSLSVEQQNAEIRTILQQQKDAMQLQSDSMWAEVFQTLSVEGSSS
ncbi:polysaccharide pyruvyl transferase family protein [Adhaeretor mobilis]|uniref:Polysaccharide pyruvyl transferase n=1 Tax=Adhaeretor mobilis TaxID=1930276 RepID=A0A517MYM1_9BACT|nr:polysaccharide pyruvyl transferase family protein [Adhaeretor mobilis]QDS99988.1 Polysaccharide pyruvyl transferase [Adhaeretor mobilis]